MAQSQTIRGIKLMTSKERHQVRYERRKAKREAKRLKVATICDNFNYVFTFSHLYKAYKCCCRNVGWKASTQLYKANAVYNIYQTYKRLQNGTFKSDGFYEFEIFERGKVRQIKSVTIRERVVQRCLCDFSLTPMLQRRLIYDNGASTKGKGYTFSINRLVKQLHHFYNINQSNEGYILLFDFSKFFDSLDHSLLKGILNKTYADEKLKKLIFHFIDMFGERGIGLGSQISQNLALVSVDKLDHYIKEVLKIKGYGRYMDDGYLIHKDKEYLKKCLTEIRKLSLELGVKLNEKKTRIVKLSKGFTYLKIRFLITPTGRIIKRIYPKSVVRMRRKLKKLKRFVDNGKMTNFDVYQSFQSWLSHTKGLNAYHTCESMKALLLKIYGGDDKCFIKLLKKTP